MVIGVGSQLRRRSDGARFDVMWVGQDTTRPGPVHVKLLNLATGRHHWVRLDTYAKRYEPCPAL